MSYSVDTISLFDKQAKILMKKYPSFKNDLSEIVEFIADNPFHGKSLGNNFTKSG